MLVTSLGTGKFGWPAGALNLFWGVLFWKRQAEAALEKSGMAYTIVRPGGMERPTDDYKKTHNVVLKPRDSIFGGQVSRLQVRMGWSGGAVLVWLCFEGGYAQMRMPLACMPLSMHQRACQCVIYPVGS